MLKHQLKTAFRSLIKNKFFSFINILGLAVGMTAAIVLAKYVGFTLTYDSFHKNKGNIYSIHHEEYINGIPGSLQNNTYWGVGYKAEELYPEVVGVTRFTGNVESLVINKNNGDLISYNENKLYTVDSSFLRIFSFPAISGDSQTALSSPNSIVLTQSTARKYFGNKDPVGQILTTRVSWGEETSYKVTCVIEDLPKNSSLQFDFLLASSLGLATEDYWHYAAHQTYLLLRESTDPTELANKMSAEVGENSILTEMGKKVDFKLSRLTDTPLSPSEWMLVLVGICILVITWMNFVNLSISRAFTRFKETGIRKVVGATKFQVIKQFVLEALLVNCIALLLALIFLGVTKPFLMDFTNGQFLPLIEDPTSINYIFVVIFFLGALVSSAYPAIVLSLSNPISALKGKATTGMQGVSLRKTLVVAQFSVSLISTISVFVISDQMEFMQNKDLKINLDRTLIIKAPKDLWEGKSERLSAFKEEAANFAMVENTTSSTTIPGQEYKHEVYFSFKDANVKSLFYLNDIEENFLSQYEVEFLAGENFSIDTYAKNKRGIILNKSAALALGLTNLEDAIGGKLMDHESDTRYELIGIVEDYHQASLKEEIKPQAFRFNESRGDISVKINESNYSDYDDIQKCILTLHELWKNIYKDQTFEYHFLDSQFNAQYQNDLNFRKVFGVFAGLSIFIACLGLFGLSLFISLKRKKEVGIRKVFGASSISILVFFIKDYVVQIVISIIIGAPVAFFLMKNWLTGFSFRTSINWWSLFLPCLFLIIVSLITIGFQTVRTALLNPLKSLGDR